LEGQVSVEPTDGAPLSGDSLVRGAVMWRLNHIRSVLVASALVLGAECSRGDREANAAADELSFEVRADLLGATFVDSTAGISFAPPVSWQPLEPGVLLAAKARLEALTATQGESLVEPVQAFVDPTTSTCCVLSRWGGPAAGDSTWKAAGLRTSQSMSARFQGAEIKESSFAYRGFRLRQYLVTTADQVMFKILAHRPGSAVIQLDYVAPKAAYAREVKAIESSIGSLRSVAFSTKDE
jgi:hypothetical protein